ncbi:transposase [Thermoanaerobacterium thermosaccharolyticum]|uniref:transposase n=1 Tax=Thermoanaerobacterium thermosaccharolyticum TaxID=1517 RepID=UPI0027A5A02F|nr:transposase [Thermoanaerobacterium thermosaccharolyticum]WHE06404.1 transposase [Thermoanaerobacterium thermosaccharolyticum]WHE06444.1 transposase [Thermoanaerobacterium thermosaccharolyticum]WHE06629.1 transposase [Thermoanaerobacterium thermosaccharolyticum]
MAFKPNEYQQITMEDRFLNLDDRTKKFVLNSWAKDFAEIIFPAINEKRFSVLYSDNPASRPNSPVNAIIGALILKEMFNLTDDELLASILCDVRFQYALHTTSFKSQPFSDRTFSRFRERLYLYNLETGRDLLHEEMEAMANVFVKYFDINPSVKRMDSIMVSSSCKKMSRLEILYTCVANMVKAVYKTGEYEHLKNMEHYLDEDDRNKTIYHRKNEEITKRLQEIIEDAYTLIKELGEAYAELPEYQLLQRVLKEQTEITEEGKIVPVEKEKISPDSLQNPSDPDATYRKKAGKDHKGYVANIVETIDEKGSIITSYDYDVNTHSDSSFCKETIEKLGKQEKEITIIADGAYSSIENIELAEKNNIELITTALIGKLPDEIQSEFKLDEVTHEIIKCPKGEKPYKTRYYEKTGLYRASFNKKTCEHCPLREKCGAKLQKKSAYVLITAKTIQRASYLKKMSTEKYSVLQKIRNGVEGIPSILRRKYHVDVIPVRGLVRSKIWFSFKIGAINAKKVLKMAAEMAASLYKNIEIKFILTKTGKIQAELLLVA